MSDESIVILVYCGLLKSEFAIRLVYFTHVAYINQIMAIVRGHYKPCRLPAKTHIADKIFE